MPRGSKRMSSSRRHKIDRKRREAKRDIRKAAKAMKAAGSGPSRKKKAREEAKSVLRMSKASARKEEVLNRLLQARQEIRSMKAERRQARKKVLGKGQALLAGDSGVPSALQRKKRSRHDDDEEEEEEFDEEEEFLDEEEEDEEEEVEEEEEAPPTAIRQQKRLLIPAAIAGNYKAQFAYFIDAAVLPDDESREVALNISGGLPTAVLVTLDARCAVQSAPWGELDYILERANAVSEDSKEKKTASTAAPKKVLVLFALCKADLVSATGLAMQYKMLSDFLAERYGPSYRQSQQAQAPSSSKKQRKTGGDSTVQPLFADEFPVEFALCPFSTQVEGTQRQLLKILRNYETAVHSATTEAGSSKGDLPHNLFHKLAVMLIGLPKTGKSSVLKSLCGPTAESSVAISMCNKLMIQQCESGATNGDTGSPLMRVIVPSPKVITILTFPDHPSVPNKNSVAAGDVIFASESVVDKVDAPEAVATMLLAQVGNLPEVAQNFSLALPSRYPSSEEAGAGAEEDEGEGKGTKTKKTDEEKLAISLLKSLGRSIIRERGFLPSVYAGATDETTPGRLAGTSDLSASAVRDASVVAISGRRIVRVWPKKSDGRNALRVGARAFLHEFSTSRHFPWAVLPADTKKMSYPLSCIFVNKYLGKDGQIDAPATAAGSFQPGLQAMQRGLTAYMVLLPRHTIAISPSAIVPETVVFQDDEEEEDSEESLDFDEEEEDSEEVSDEEDEEAEDEE